MKLTLVVLLAVVVAAFLPSGNAAILGGALCDTCTSLVQMAEGAGEGFGAPWLKQQVDKLCDPLGIFKQFCIDEFDKIVDALVILIDKGLPPLKCCEAVELCN